MRIDGKHIRINAPSKSGSKYINHKGYFSINLFAICDAEYKFMYTEIGSLGSKNNAGIYHSSVFGSLLENNLFKPNSIAMNMQYIFVMDVLFTLHLKKDFKSIKWYFLLEV
jgi:hypothetical protein